MKCSTKPKRVDYFQVPRRVWRTIKRWLPKPTRQRTRGRAFAAARGVLNAIWYVLWTGCQWKALKREWFGVSSSTVHRYFQKLQQGGLCARILRTLVRF